MKTINVEVTSKLLYVIGIITLLGAQPTNGQLPTLDTTASDADLETGFYNMVFYLNSRWSSGITSLDIPPMDPLAFDGMTIDGGDSLVNFNATLSNVMIIGISQLYPNLTIVLNSTAHTYGFTVGFPSITVNGTYSATGNLIPLLYPLVPLTHITGSGNFYINFVRPQVVALCSVSNVTVGTNTYSALSNCVVEITISSYSVQFDNIGGNPVSALAINLLLNAGSSIIWPQLQPEFESTLAGLIPEAFNPFLITQPYLAAILK